MDSFAAKVKCGPPAKISRCVRLEKASISVGVEAGVSRNPRPGE